MAETMWLKAIMLISLVAVTVAAATAKEALILDYRTKT